MALHQPKYFIHLPPVSLFVFDYPSQHLFCILAAMSGPSQQLAPNMAASLAQLSPAKLSQLQQQIPDLLTDAEKLLPEDKRNEVFREKMLNKMVTQARQQQAQQQQQGMGMNMGQMGNGMMNLQNKPQMANQSVSNKSIHPFAESYLGVSGRMADPHDVYRLTKTKYGCSSHNSNNNSTSLLCWRNPDKPRLLNINIPELDLVNRLPNQDNKR